MDITPDTDWTATTHYSLTEQGALQVPETTSSLQLGELSSQTPDGSSLITEFPDRQGEMQAWVKAGVGTDRHGDKRVALIRTEEGQQIGATIPAEQYIKARELLRNKLAILALEAPSIEVSPPVTARPEVTMTSEQQMKYDAIVGRHTPRPRSFDV